MTVERYSHVMHITCQVAGELADGPTPSTCCGPRFPAGTVSGAPKVRAMQIIDELEPAKRGPYAGAVGYVDFSGNLDTCIAIRTMVVGDGSERAGRRGHRRRFRPGRRRPGMQQQGAGVAECRGRRTSLVPGGPLFMTDPETQPLDTAGGARDVVVASGPDAPSFLQGLVSQDLDPIAVGSGGSSLLLQPQGKLIAPFRALRVGDDDFWLDGDAGTGGALLEGLQPIQDPREG